MSNLELIRKLREATGCGMMSCKKALEETSNNYDKALDHLRKQGVNSAKKKSSRDASEGLVAIKSNEKKHVIIKLNSETDFVAKNTDFINLTDDICSAALNCTGDMKSLETTTIPNKKTTVSEEIINQISKLGENIKLSEFQSLENNNGFIAHYIHNALSENSGKIAVLLSVDIKKISDNAKTLAKQIAMHIAANSPASLDVSDLSKDIINKEREIQKEIVIKSGKPEHIAEKMIEGKMNKFYQDVVLLKQPFVLDNKTPIFEIIDNFNKKNASNFKISSYIRFALAD